MNGNNALLDTNIIILISKQKIDPTQLLEKYDAFYVSVVTYMEVYGYEFEKPSEKALIDDLFEALEVVHINLEIANRVIEYRKNKVRKIKLPDAIILATAQVMHADLITADRDDFKDIDDTVIIPVLRI